jgi:hypothetical protein
MLTCRSTAVRLIGASLDSVPSRTKKELDIRCVSHQFGLMSGVDDYSVYPAGITQLGSS